VSDDNSFVAHIPDPVFRSYKSASRSLQMPKSPKPRPSFRVVLGWRLGYQSE
jgi:hypothetical protein